jgi:hypothetical protein
LTQVFYDDEVPCHVLEVDLSEELVGFLASVSPGGELVDDAEALRPSRTIPRW